MKKTLFFLLIPLLGLSQTVPDSVMIGGVSVDSIMQDGAKVWEKVAGNPELFGDYAHTYNSGTTSTKPTIGSCDGCVVQSSATYTAVIDVDSFGLGDYVVEVEATATGHVRVRLYMDLPNGVYDWKLTWKTDGGRFFIYDGASSLASVYQTNNIVTEETGSFTAVTGGFQQFSVGHSNAVIGKKLRFKISVKAQ